MLDVVITDQALENDESIAVDDDTIQEIKRISQIDQWRTSPLLVNIDWVDHDEPYRRGAYLFGRDDYINIFLAHEGLKKNFSEVLGHELSHAQLSGIGALERRAVHAVSVLGGLGIGLKTGSRTIKSLKNVDALADYQVYLAGSVLGVAMLNVASHWLDLGFTSLKSRPIFEARARRAERLYSHLDPFVDFEPS